MTNQEWIPINEYSSKYNISQSTLRRRIRAGDIENKFQHGKYWLMDKPIYRYFRPLHPVDSAPIEQPEMVAPNQPQIQNQSAIEPVPENQSVRTQDIAGFMESANNLMQDLKGAYVTVLHEKEMQIMQLKEEISNLKTLVKILESENDRLSSNIKESAPIDSWLDKNFE